MGIEPITTVWKTVVLPVNYTRLVQALFYHYGHRAATGRISR